MSPHSAIRQTAFIFSHRFRWLLSRSLSSTPSCSQHFLFPLRAFFNLRSPLPISLSGSLFPRIYHHCLSLCVLPLLPQISHLSLPAFSATVCSLLSVFFVYEEHSQVTVATRLLLGCVGWVGCVELVISLGFGTCFVLCVCVGFVWRCWS
jgi:hypothetical protein